MRLHGKAMVFSLMGAPLYLLIHFDGLTAMPGNLSVGRMLALRSFGMLALYDFRNLTDIIGGIAFIILFNILFSGYISAHFRFSCVYVFSRIRSRQSWYCKRCIEITLYAGIYSLLYVLAGVMLCCRMVIVPLAFSDFPVVLQILFYSMLLIVNTTIFLNLLSLKTGTMTGFVVTQAIVFALIFMDMVAESPVITTVNPISMLQFGLLTQPQRAGTLTMNILILLALLILGGRYVKRYDVALLDAENN